MEKGRSRVPIRVDQQSYARESRRRASTTGGLFFLVLAARNPRILEPRCGASVNKVQGEERKGRGKSGGGGDYETTTLSFKHLRQPSLFLVSKVRQTAVGTNQIVFVASMKVHIG